jgi:hypothetical protein
MSDEQFEGRRDYTDKLTRDREDTKYARDMSKELRAKWGPLSEANLKAEKAFNLLGSGQLQDKVALMSIIKDLEGRMTDADRDYYSAETAILAKLHATLNQQKGNTLNPRLLQDAEVILRNSINMNNKFLEGKIADAERIMKAEGIKGDIRSRLPSLRAAKLGETLWVKDPKNPSGKIRLKKVDGGWEMYGEE